LLPALTAKQVIKALQKTLQDVFVGEPETAGNKRPFITGQAVDRAPGSSRNILNGGIGHFSGPRIGPAGLPWLRCCYSRTATPGRFTPWRRHRKSLVSFRYPCRDKRAEDDGEE
jgi:hypothetical protein